jgi:hypothetical protein
MMKPLGGEMRKLILISMVLVNMFLSLDVYSQRRKPTRPTAPTATQKSDSPILGFEQITSDKLRRYLEFIASDELEGRDTPSQGLDIAAKFIAFNLSQLGVKPGGGNGTYFQRIAMKRYNIDPEKTTASLNNRSFTLDEDFVASPFPGTVNGTMVYVSHGWVARSKGINAYQGVDVKDKIMIVYGSGRPPNITLEDIRGRQGEDWDSPSSYGLRNGAKGIITVPGFQHLASWNLAQNRSTRNQAVVEAFETTDRNQLPTITPSIPMLNLIFRAERLTAAEVFNNNITGASTQAFDLSANKRISFTVAMSDVGLKTQNVIGIIEGSDPVLKNEYIAIGSHYDHVGVGLPVGNDKIYNGADDDGSGTVAMMAIAEAFMRASIRPKRSILLIWHSGEEKGLWGSRYFTQFPTVPLDKIIAQLNIDMIGRSKRAGDTNPQNAELSGPNEIYVIGSKMMSTELGELSDTVNNTFFNFIFNYRYDDPQDPNRFFFRSDHYNYALKGIPIIFYFDGVHEDYHQPSDTYDKIDYQKLEKVTRLIYATARALSNRPERPKVDKTLPPGLGPS